MAGRDTQAVEGGAPDAVEAAHARLSLASVGRSAGGGPAGGGSADGRSESRRAGTVSRTEEERGAGGAPATLRIAPGGDSPAEAAAVTLPVFAAAGDEFGQARACLRLAQHAQEQGRHREAERLLDRALGHAVRADAEPERAAALGAMGVSLWRGPLPVVDAVTRCRALLAEQGAGSGVAAITSAVPSLDGHAVAMSVFFVAVLAWLNLRGVRESGRWFALPTYAFITVIYLMFAVAAVRMATGATIRAESADLPVEAVSTYSGIALVLLALRAFASGCTALTGVEAVSNGVPAFAKPKSRNAAMTLAIMGGLSVTMFFGITVLAMVYEVHVAEDPTELGLPPGTPTSTALAQIGRATFGDWHVLFYALQAVTAGVLILAANTAFNGFPMLASVLGRDRYAPRQLFHRGDRLVYSNGIVLLALAAIVLIVAFDAQLTRLIQLYIIGVFVSFTLSQAGMVKHWRRELATPEGAAGRHTIHRRLAINAFGACLTAVVLVIVLITKFTHGAWIVVIAMPVLFAGMKGVRRHYDAVAAEVAVTPGQRPRALAENHVL
ncbi:APC family permease, partial [Streptomyces massasporeus]